MPGTVFIDRCANSHLDHKSSSTIGRRTLEPMCRFPICLPMRRSAEGLNLGCPRLWRDTARLTLTHLLPAPVCRIYLKSEDFPCKCCWGPHSWDTVRLMIKGSISKLRCQPVAQISSTGHTDIRSRSDFDGRRLTCSHPWTSKMQLPLRIAAIFTHRVLTIVSQRVSSTETLIGYLYSGHPHDDRHSVGHQ
ncbi:hypothetical protein EJ06DRAFT_106225 [Trichodelitschia bisporula]|uniref:Uncharacterized protein n=1 Tax=Trichodelitschia bisporula TaxID=703511 RepID=A0A6G1HQU3_9PEZI|nr:hypothetical protein EJ06DRAFT_106225 [Trichodelitschia bisporula]